MNPQLEGIEIKMAAIRDDELSIEYAFLRQLFADRLKHLGEVAVERLFIPALEQHFVPIAKDEHAEAVPLGLVYPIAF